MLATQIMTTPVVTVDPYDRLHLVKAIFDNRAFHHLLVVAGGSLVGVISDRDYFKAVSHRIDLPAATLHDEATLNKRAHQIMSRDPICVAPDTGIDDVVERFLEHRISCLPVVNAAAAPVGILSWRDVFTALRRQRQESEAC